MLKERINEVIGTTPILCFICFINHALVKCKLTKGKTKPTKTFPFQCTHWKKDLNNILSNYYKHKINSISRGDTYYISDGHRIAFLVSKYISFIKVNITQCILLVLLLSNYHQICLCVFYLQFSHNVIIIRTKYVRDR